MLNGDNKDNEWKKTISRMDGWNQGSKEEDRTAKKKVSNHEKQRRLAITAQTA